MIAGQLENGSSATCKDNVKDIVFAIDHENDPLKVRALAHELNEAMLSEERRRVEQRLRALSNPSEVTL